MYKLMLEKTLFGAYGNNLQMSHKCKKISDYLYSCKQKYVIWKNLYRKFASILR